jgi:hypothetical protein
VLAIFNLVILAGLMLVFIQDIKSRAVYWIVFPILAVLFYASQSLTNNLFSPLQSAAFNIGFIVLQLVLVTVWFSFKNRRLVNITNGLLGWGDVLFIVSVAFYLPLPNFIAFYLISLLASLLIWILWQTITTKKDGHIPLAGLQALLLSLLIITSWINPKFRLTNDGWLLTYYSRAALWI